MYKLSNDYCKFEVLFVDGFGVRSVFSEGINNWTQHRIRSFAQSQAALLIVFSVGGID